MGSLDCLTEKSSLANQYINTQWIRVSIFQVLLINHIRMHANAIQIKSNIFIFSFKPLIFLSFKSYPVKRIFSIL